MKKLNLAVIGAGSIFWNTHAKNLKDIGGNRIVAVCDPSEKAQQRVVDELGAKAYDSIETMMAEHTDLDALLNLSPPVVRKEAINAAVKAGIPLFMEKPPARSVAEAKEIQAILQKNSVPHSVGFMWRYLPAMDRLKEILDGKTITHVYSEFYCEALTKWNMGGWFLMKDQSGGPILDQAIHLMDLVRYVVGDVDEVMSFGGNLLFPKSESMTIEDISSTILRLKSGVLGAHLQSWVTDGMDGLITVQLQDGHVTWKIDGSLSGKIGDEVIAFDPNANGEPEAPHRAEVRVFLEAVRSGDFSAVRSSFADATRTLAVVQAINEAMESGSKRKVETV